MKKMFAIMFLVIFSIPVFSQTAPKTVTDYFLLLPGGYFSTDFQGNHLKTKAALEKFRRSIIETEDIKNGYLNLITYEGWSEVAIFRKNAGGYVVGVARTVCDPDCDGKLIFLTYDKGKWTDVTKDVFPMPTKSELKILYQREDVYEDSKYFFNLPQIGRIVDMACESCADYLEDKEIVLMQFSWNGEKFERMDL